MCVWKLRGSHSLVYFSLLSSILPPPLNFSSSLPSLPPHFLSPIPFPILHSPLQPPSLFFPSHFSLSLFLSPSSSRPWNIPLPLYLLSPSLFLILPFSLPPYFFLPISPSPFFFPPLLPDPQTFLFPSVI